MFFTAVSKLERPTLQGKATRIRSAQARKSWSTRPSTFRRKRPRTCRVCAPGVRRSWPPWRGTMHAETFDPVHCNAVAFQATIERVAAHPELFRGSAEIAAVGADDLQ